MMVGRGQLAGGGMTMGQLATMLGNQLGRTVIDKTGLAGSYDIKLEWTPDPGQGGALRPPVGAEGTVAPVDGTGPSIFTAIQEQLGLKIDSSKGPVEVIVIDRADKPTEQQ
jgi:bla regulator protein blaR1